MTKDVPPRPTPLPSPNSKSQFIPTTPTRSTSLTAADATYHASLQLLAPLKNLCLELDPDFPHDGGTEEHTLAVVDDRDQRLFTVQYNKVLHHVATHVHGGSGRWPTHSVKHYNHRVTILDFQGHVMVRTEFPVAGGTADVFVGDRIIGTARVPDQYTCGCCGGAKLSVSTREGSTGFWIEASAAHVTRIRNPEGGWVVAEMGEGGTDATDAFCIEFLDPKLDAEGKMLLLLALAPQAVQRNATGCRGCHWCGKKVLIGGCVGMTAIILIALIFVFAFVKL